MDWIYLAEDTDRWLVLVKAAVALGFYEMQENSSAAEEVLAVQEGLCSMELTG